MKLPLISASVLSANFARFPQEIKRLQSANINWIHYDVMDGNFVSNITFGHKILGEFSNEFPNFIWDVHMMVINPEKQIIKFARAGANIITVHFEALNFDEVTPLLRFIKERKCKAGLSIKPDTKVELIYEYLEYIDLCLVMSVNPGAGGQKFIPKTLKKIEKLKNYRAKMPLCNFLISVDGGINAETAPACIKAGADIVVSGSYLFNAPDLKANANKLLI